MIYRNRIWREKKHENGFRGEEQRRQRRIEVRLEGSPREKGIGFWKKRKKEKKKQKEEKKRRHESWIRRKKGKERKAKIRVYQKGENQEFRHYLLWQKWQVHHYSYISRRFPYLIRLQRFLGNLESSVTVRIYVGTKVIKKTSEFVSMAFYSTAVQYCDCTVAENSNISRSWFKINDCISFDISAQTLQFCNTMYENLKNKTFH